MRASRWLNLILIIYLCLGVTYALTTPPFEASDELWHYPLVRHLAQGQPLPVQDPQQVGPWRQEASQPPLYYYLMAGLTAWIDTSDMEQVRWLNPHVDNGVVTSDGNRNLAVHDPTLSRWQGTLLALTVARLASVALGGATVYLTYRLGREAFPGRQDIPLAAAAFTACLPMFVFISASVNNDNLVTPLAALALWLMARGVRRPPAAGRPEWRFWLGLGVVIGAAALTKISGVGLLPLALGAAYLTRWQARPSADRGWADIGWAALEAIPRFLVVALSALAVAGWWYARNLRLYGDWNGWSAFIEVLGQRAHPASLAQLWDERAGFMMSYWGLFGGVNQPMSGWVYTWLNGVLLVALGGGVVAAVRALRPLLVGPWRTWPMRALDTVARHFTLVLALAWTAAVVWGVIQWATVTWSSQGRLVFSALSAEMVLLATGLAGWLPPRLGRLALGGLALFLAGVAVAAPWVWIRPAYTPPVISLPAGQSVINYDTVGLDQLPADFGQQLRLNRAVIQPTVLQPGDRLAVYLEWEALAPSETPWSVFVHLHDPVLDTPVAQRDMYLGQGLRPASWLQPGEVVVNVYHLTLPPGLVTPAGLELRVGLYDFASQRRLPLVTGETAALLTTLSVQAPAGAHPNPLQVNFGDIFDLVGYDLSARRLRPGETLSLTLFVTPRRPPPADFSFFAQVLAETESDTTRYAAFDVVLPTQAWTPGVVQRVDALLTISATAPPGIYRLATGIYTQADGVFNNLPLVTPDGRITNDNRLILTKVRLDALAE